MKKYYLLVALILVGLIFVPVFWIIGMRSSPESVPVAEPIQSELSSFKVELTTEPGQAEPNQPVKLMFAITDGLGQLVSDFEIVHEKPMHLIVVSDDLAFFDHIHPERTPSGQYAVETRFPSAGQYKLYLDYKPKDASPQLGRAEVNVVGASRERVRLIPETSYKKRFGDLRIAMKANKPLRAHEAITLTFEVEDARTNKPVIDLQPYLGALAHFVIISQDTAEFLHAHPLDPIGQQPVAYRRSNPSQRPAASQRRNGPEVTTRTFFPKPGLYKLWAQFRRNDQVMTGTYVINVQEGALEEVAAGFETEDGYQQIRIEVSEKGYDPSSIKLKRGIPARIIFYRVDANNCGGEVFFRGLNFRKTLPVGETVKIEFIPEKDGKYTFTCGMNMLRGTLVIAN